MKAEFEAVLRSEAVARLPIDGFARVIGVNRGCQIARLLDAGAHLPSEIARADRCAWKLTHSIFVKNKSTLRDSIDGRSPGGRKARILHWLAPRGNYPPAGSSQEYSIYSAEWDSTVADNRTKNVVPQWRSEIWGRLPWRVPKSPITDSPLRVNFGHLRDLRSWHREVQLHSTLCRYGAYVNAVIVQGHANCLPNRFVIEMKKTGLGTSIIQNNLKRGNVRVIVTRAICRNEIVWRRNTGHQAFGDVSDTPVVR
ncbi:hypothetical protein KNO81_31335 [Paraburkholderia sediminicola]|nr:hypothetical protein [Paraburkholderia sediminicola]